MSDLVVGDEVIITHLVNGEWRNVVTAVIGKSYPVYVIETTGGTRYIRKSRARNSDVYDFVELNDCGAWVKESMGFYWAVKAPKQDGVHGPGTH